MSSIDQELATLCRALGDPDREWAILAEGNAAARDGERLLVTASGSSLLDPSIVCVDLDAVLAALEEAGDDAAWERAIGGAVCGAHAAVRPMVDGARAAMRPTVEVGLHAVAAASEGVHFVGHTHPTAVNGVLCSTRAAAIAAGALFPDQVVVCGAHPLFMPYVDPGMALARGFRDELRAHCERHGSPPKVVYLQSHGLIALGASALEVVQITSMADKAARILTAALAGGDVRYLDQTDVERIDGRADEAHRRAVLAAGQLEA
jgi:rhamnose utilization protein RhaD (predicted bifunctional aldolase and dehydrogenase)